MTTLEADAPTLLDLVARRWTMPASIVAVAFTTNSTSVAFVDADGRAWQTPTADPESSTRRYHVAADTGRPTISPRRKGPAAISPVAIDDQVVCITTFENDVLALGCASGRVVGISPRGRISAITKEAGSIDALRSVEQGRALFVASAGVVNRLRTNGPTTQVTALGESGANNLAVSSDARSIAWCAEGRLRIQIDGSEIVDTGLPTSADHVDGVVAWSPSGHWLAVAPGGCEIVLLQIAGGRVARTVPLRNYPASVSVLSWSANGNLLATNGAYRIVVWDTDALGRDPDAAPSTQQTGRSRSVTVSAVAFHPSRSIVAAAFDDGLIVIAQTNRPDELILRDRSDGKVTALCWSGDGTYLAVGTTNGEAIVAEFPPNFFK